MKICETVMTPTMAAMRAGRDAATAASRAGSVALVELRLDGLDPSELNVASALADRALPVIVTCRPTWEGGQFAGSDEERLRILCEAARLGAEFIDIEMDADQHHPGFMDELQRSLSPTSRLVVSHHDFAPGIRVDLAERVAAQRQLAARLGRQTVTKIAVMAERAGDCAQLRALLCEGGRMRPQSISIAMGAAGALSRLLPAKFSTEWTYAGAAAPGQLGVELLLSRFHLHRHTESTRVFGIAGAPLAHSASPAMHNAAFAALDMDAVFVPVETTDADELFRLADALELEGLSVTAPLKSAVLRTATEVELDSEAFAIGAINTLRRSSAGSWSGRNFDAAAFRSPLDEISATLRERRAIVLGAGGAARSAVRELSALGARVEISARDRAKADLLATAMGVAVTDWPPSGEAAIVVNATPIGTTPNVTASPVPAASVTTDVAYDLVYNPDETQFLKDARTAGARTIGGLTMLVAQAGRQFEWWTGVRVSPDVLMRAAQEFIR